MTDQNRDDLIDDLTPEELQVEKAKLKKEGDKEHLKHVEEEQWKDAQERAVADDSEHEQKLKDEKIVEGKEEGLATDEKSEDVYVEKERQELLDDDEIEEQEAGFMEGYERDSEKPKKKEPLSDEERL